MHTRLQYTSYVAFVRICTEYRVLPSVAHQTTVHYSYVAFVRICTEYRVLPSPWGFQNQKAQTFDGAQA